MQTFEINSRNLQVFSIANVFGFFKLSALKLKLLEDILRFCDVTNEETSTKVRDFYLKIKANIFFCKETQRRIDTFVKYTDSFFFVQHKEKIVYQQKLNSKAFAVCYTLIWFRVESKENVRYILRVNSIDSACVCTDSVILFIFAKSARYFDDFSS